MLGSEAAACSVGLSVKLGNLRHRTVQIVGLRQPLGVGVIRKQELTVLETVYHLPRHFARHGGTAVAAAESSVALDPVRVHVIRTVDDNGAVAGEIVDARLQSVHAQRVAVLTE